MSGVPPCRVWKEWGESVQIIQREKCNVIWVHFGFNVGSEFGGHHPTIVVRKMGNAVNVIPLNNCIISEELIFHRILVVFQKKL